jgi:serine/threonine protein kinase
MSYCLNPDCQKPQNSAGAIFCLSCGSKLLLGERYRAIKLIGQGGFGRTFLAVDEYKASKPRCVIKQFYLQF